MTPLRGLRLLIIDFPEACLLRARLMQVGATVHVVSAQNRCIDAAFVGFSMAAETRRLCEQLIHLGVGQVVVTPGDIGNERLEKERPMLPDIILGMSRIGAKQLDVTLH